MRLFFWFCELVSLHVAFFGGIPFTRVSRYRAPHHTPSLFCGCLRPQRPKHPHIPLAPPMVFADGARLIAEAHDRDHSFSANPRASQIGASGWFISVDFWRTDWSSLEVSQLRIAPSLVVRWEGGGGLVGWGLHHTSLHAPMTHVGSRDTAVSFLFSFLHLYWLGAVR